MLAEFLGINNATLESPGVNLGDHSLADWWFGGSVDTASGVKVSHRSALTLSPLFQAIGMISGDYASLPVHIYQRLPDDNREIDTANPAEYLINQQANEYTTAFDFWRTIIAHALLWGNGYGAITRKGGMGPEREPTGLYNLLPDRTEPEWAGVNGETLVYHTETSDRPRWFHHTDVLHIRGVVIDGQKGVDLIAKARDMIGTALAAQNFAAKFFKSGGRTGGILELPSAMGKTARDVVEEGFRKTYESVDNAFKTVILRDNAKFHAAQASFEQTQMVESREEEARNVARIFNLPPHKLGITGSVSYNSQEQGDLAYLKGCLSNWLMQGKTQIESKVLTEAQRRGRTHYVDHVTAKLLQTDVKTTNEVLTMQIQNTIISPNEARAVLNRNKREGGDVYENPNTKSRPPSGQDEPPKAKLNLIPYAVAFLEGKRMQAVTNSSSRQQPQNVTYNIPAPIINLPPIEIPATVVNVAVPEQPPANITVAVPEQPAPIVQVTVAAADPAPIEFKVIVPEQPINVTVQPAPAAEIVLPDTFNVSITEMPEMETTLVRDSDGEVVRSIQKPVAKKKKK